MAKSPRNLNLKEKRFRTVADVQIAYNEMVRKLNEMHKYNHIDHEKMEQDIADLTP